MRVCAGLILLLLPFLSAAAENGYGAGPSADGPTITDIPKVLAGLPVLHNGRVKPLSVAARQTVRTVTGKGRFGVTVGTGAGMSVTDAKDGTTVLVSWWSEPDKWVHQGLVEVPLHDLQAELGVGRWASLAELRGPTAGPFLGMVTHANQHAESTGERKTDWTPVKEAALEVSRTVPFAERAMAGQTIGLVPLIADEAQLDWVMGRILLIDPSRAWQAQLQEIVGDLASTGGPNWQQEARDRVVEANLWLSVYDVALDPDPAIAGWPDPLGLRELSAAWGQAVLGNGDLAATTTDLEAGLFRLADIEHLQGQGAGEHYPSADKIAIEQFYEASRIFTWTWLAYILGGILTGVGLARSKGDGWGLLAKIGVGVTILGMLLNCAGFGLRLSVSSWGAVTNFYETFIYVALIVAIIGVLFSVIYRNGLYAVAGGIGAGLCAMVGEAMPPDLGKDINRLQPVLRSSFWLWVHVKVIVASYGAFLLAWLLANIHLTKGAILGKSVPASAGKAIYRCLQVGVVLCVAGTLLGGVWADQAWGRFWGWDPKEVWALIIILAYLIPLHLRYIGVVQATGLAAWSIYGFASVVFSWYGVNFLLGAGLHSYGFGSGGQHIVLPICLAQIIITTVQLVLIYVRKQPPAATPAAGA